MEVYAFGMMTGILVVGTFAAKLYGMMFIEYLRQRGEWTE